MKLEARLSRAHDMLRKCALQFEYYERNHRAKGTNESLEKAEVNALFVRQINDVLEGL